MGFRCSNAHTHVTVRALAEHFLLSVRTLTCSQRLTLHTDTQTNKQTDIEGHIILFAVHSDTVLWIS